MLKSAADWSHILQASRGAKRAMMTHGQLLYGFLSCPQVTFCPFLLPIQAIRAERDAGPRFWPGKELFEQLALWFNSNELHLIFNLSIFSPWHWKLRCIIKNLSQFCRWRSETKTLRKSRNLQRKKDSNFYLLSKFDVSRLHEEMPEREMLVRILTTATNSNTGCSVLPYYEY